MSVPRANGGKLAADARLRREVVCFTRYPLLLLCGVRYGTDDYLEDVCFPFSFKQTTVCTRSAMGRVKKRIVRYGWSFSVTDDTRRDCITMPWMPWPSIVLYYFAHVVTFWWFCPLAIFCTLSNYSV